MSMEYYHLGIYLGGERQEVIDYINDSTVRRIRLTVFTEDNTRPLYRIRYIDASPAYEPEEIISRAVKTFTNDDFGTYDSITNNCEHFATDCTFGKKYSYQVAQKVRTITSICVTM